MKKTDRPDRVLTYFTSQKGLLAALTAVGLIYNAGLAAGPWFEGQLAQCLLQISRREKTFSDMLILAVGYILTIAAVQGARFLKRLFVRKFGNNINRRMKQVFYANLVTKSRAELQDAGAGSVMAKAIGDADACSEGIRKFTTELFDTGVALIVYVVMLMSSDWRLALLCMIFPPISYIIAQKMKVIVQRTGAANRECAGALSEATLDRVSNAVTYRIFGCEENRNAAYDAQLRTYEKSAVRAGIPAVAMQPLYQAAAMLSAVFILYFGAKNVQGTGWTSWDIAAFTTFLSCFAKLAVKSSKAAKLFNAVQKAQVSWKRIRDYLKPCEDLPKTEIQSAGTMEGKDLSAKARDGRILFEHLDFTVHPGQIIGVTGPVACGKSTLGRILLDEAEYDGRILFGGKPIEDPSAILGYLGHDPELLNDTIENNVLLGSSGDAWVYLRAVCLDEEVAAMPDGLQTRVGDAAVRLSGGQKQRLALARTLAHPKPFYVLDDPFSALDKVTEMQIFANLRDLMKDSGVLLISHRLTLFDQSDGVIWMQDGRARFASHDTLMQTEPLYRRLVEIQSSEEVIL